MERLNEIVSRVAQRRQQESGYRSAHEMPSQGLRARAGAPAPRRALPEQTARLGRPSRPGLQEQQPSLPPRPLNQQRALPNRLTGERNSPQERPTRSGYSTPAQSEPYHPRTHADVLEEWEDDTATIRYGDWESDIHEEPSTTREPQAPYISPASPAAARIAHTYATKNSRPLVTRQLYKATEEESPAANRESRLPAPLPASQEITRAHRQTQPLNRSQALARMNQQESSSAQPGRQVIVRPLTTSSSYSSASSSCPICKGAGYLRANVPFGHPNFGKPIACECKEAERKEKRRLQLYELSNLGAFQDKSFASFNPRISGVQEAFQIAREFADAPDGWLLLVGPNGCGKTHLAAAIANQSLEDGATVLFATVPDLLDHLRAAFAPTSNEVYDQLFARMREAEVLVLDDLGAQQSSPWANEKLFQLLNYRYNSRFPTVITANPKGLQAIDERIRSRLTDMSLVITVLLDRTRDYRPHNPRRE